MQTSLEQFKSLVICELYLLSKVKVSAEGPSQTLTNWLPLFTSWAQ